jgi:2-oxoglutarate ferredoxin oxidoreductase subunit delta
MARPLGLGPGGRSVLEGGEQLKGYVFFEEDRCKGCQLCAPVCAKAVIQMSGRINVRGYHPAEAASPDDCTGCGLCARMCPDTVIRVYREVPAKAGKG